MHPNAFLRSLWRTEIRDQVFVAMSFEDRFRQRYEEVIKPAIEAELIGDRKLSAYRVDNSKTGDSILTDIVDGIAHSRLVLADVSAIDKSETSKIPVRNGNVMYEAGVALACRMPSEVLLIRDDSEKFLFDVSTIPYMQVDFAEHDGAIKSIREKLAERLSETNRLEDVRIQKASQALTQDEVRILKKLAELKPTQARVLVHPKTGLVSSPNRRGLDGLIARGCIRSSGIDERTGAVFHGLNEFGYALAEVVEHSMRKVRPEELLRSSNNDDNTP